MKIIFLSDFCKRTGSIDICVPRAATLAAAGMLGLAALGAWGDFCSVSAMAWISASMPPLPECSRCWRPNVA